jgi:hypothetical protein
MRNGEYYLAVVSHDANIGALKHTRRYAKLMDLGTSARLGAVWGAGILFDRGVADRGVYRSMNDDGGVSRLLSHFEDAARP